ncbi:MAG: hypothetical protein ACI8R0_003217 [Alteromonadales bacterium]|jgi:hypothetical protein
MRKICGIDQVDNLVYLASEHLVLTLRVYTSMLLYQELQRTVRKYPRASCQLFLVLFWRIPHVQSRRPHSELADYRQRSYVIA